jgi:spore coat polysaccharide biosynthesis predicted glycosyltransferase SpsG
VSSEVLLCCDEGPGAGLGHRARCEAVARELRSLGQRAIVIATGDGIVAAPVIVVDSYHYRADDRHHFVPDVVVAIEDLERDQAVDCIVAPSPGACADAFHHATRVLAGARYALIDSLPAGAVAPNSGAPATGCARVLVAGGAADTRGIGAGIAAAIHAARPALEVELVVGPWGCDAVPDGVTALTGLRSLTVPLQHADLVVTAGGVTLLEALHLGRPCVTFAVAANQQANVDAVAAAGAAVVTDVGHAAAAAYALIDDDSGRAALAAAGAALVDGEGASRVARVITELATPPRRPRAREVVGSAP